MALLGVVGAALLGYLLGSFPLFAVAGTVAVLVAGLFVFRPTWAYWAILLSVSGFVNVYAYPRVSSVFMSELLLAVAVAAAIPEFVNLVRTGTVRLDWIFWSVAGLFAVCVLGILVGIQGGAERNTALLEFRPMLYLLALVPALVAVSTPARERVTMVFAAVLAFAVSIAAIAQAYLGTRATLFDVAGFDALVRTDPATGFLRIRPPGLYLIYAAAAWAACRLIWGRPGRGRLASGVLLAAAASAIALSFNRNMLVGLVVGILAASLFTHKRLRVGAIALLVAFLLVVALMALGQSQLDQPLIARFASLFSPDARTAALADRAYESAAALGTVLAHPVLGVGWGQGYGATATRLSGGVVSTFDRPWIHNQVLSFWVRAGAIGALLLVGLFVGLIVSAARTARGCLDEDDEWVNLALIASLTAFAVSSQVDITIANPNNLVVFLGLAAIVSVRGWARRSRAAMR